MRRFILSDGRRPRDRLLVIEKVCTGISGFNEPTGCRKAVFALQSPMDGGGALGWAQGTGCRRRGRQ